MSWLKPHHTKPYYYRSRRINGRVVNEYLGNSPELAKSLQLQAAATDAEHLALQPYQKFIQQYDEIQEYIKLLIRATLLINGYHPHKNQWRKKRAKTSSPQTKTQKTNPAPSPSIHSSNHRPTL